MTIHRTALVHPTVKLGNDVDIGPFANVEEGVTIGDRTQISAYALLSAGCEIGADCQVHSGAALGQPAQIRGLTGPGGGLTIGSRNIIREHVTIHRASEPGRKTIIGCGNLLLACSHVGHDCRVGDDTTIANGALLAGHVTLEQGAFVSGNVGIHQFVRVGTLSMIGGQARVSKDVPPFMMVVGDSRVRGLNIVGMRRAGISADRRRLVRQAFEILYRSGLNVSQASTHLRALPQEPEICALLRFIEASTRGLCAGGPRGRRMQSIRNPVRRAV